MSENISSYVSAFNKSSMIRANDFRKTISKLFACNLHIILRSPLIKETRKDRRLKIGGSVDLPLFEGKNDVG